MRVLRYRIVKFCARFFRVPVEVHANFTAPDRKCFNTSGRSTSP